MKNLTEIRAAKTIELVNYYNANSGKSAITKFVDRATAEKRCVDLFETLAKPASGPMTMSLADTEAFAKALQDAKARPTKAVKVAQPKPERYTTPGMRVVEAVAKAIKADEVEDFANVTEEEHAEHRAEEAVRKVTAKSVAGNSIFDLVRKMHAEGATRSDMVAGIMRAFPDAVFADDVKKASKHVSWYVSAIKKKV